MRAPRERSTQLRRMCGCKRYRKHFRSCAKLCGVSLSIADIKVHRHLFACNFSSYGLADHASCKYVQPVIHPVIRTCLKFYPSIQRREMLYQSEKQ